MLYRDMCALGLGVHIDLDGWEGFDLASGPSPFPLPQAAAGTPSKPAIPASLA